MPGKRLSIKRIVEQAREEGYKAARVQNFNDALKALREIQKDAKAHDPKPDTATVSKSKSRGGSHHGSHARSSGVGKGRKPGASHVRSDDSQHSDGT